MTDQFDLRAKILNKLAAAKRKERHWRNVFTGANKARRQMAKERMDLAIGEIKTLEELLESTFKGPR